MTQGIHIPGIIRADEITSLGTVEDASVPVHRRLDICTTVACRITREFLIARRHSKPRINRPIRNMQHVRFGHRPHDSGPLRSVVASITHDPCQHVGAVRGVVAAFTGLDRRGQRLAVHLALDRLVIHVMESSQLVCDRGMLQRGIILHRLRIQHRHLHTGTINALLPRGSHHIVRHRPTPIIRRERAGRPRARQHTRQRERAPGLHPRPTRNHEPALPGSRRLWMISPRSFMMNPLQSESVLS